MTEILKMASFINEHERFRSTNPTNAITVDVEDYFQVSAFEKIVNRSQWDGFPLRVHNNLERILELFDRFSVRGTFFTLGWVAERLPQLIRKISEAGHEIASHGYQHIRVTEQTPTQFRADIERTKRILEDVTGEPVQGYRAASFSIHSENLWAFNELEEAGYRYSSSVYPINHDLYGMPDAPRFPFRFQSGGLLEIPVTTSRIMGYNLPCGGGGYFRLYPYRFTRWVLRRVNKQDLQPTIFYFHPWELDSDQPKITGITAKTKFRHYVNLKRMQSRLQRLLTDFTWDRMDRIFINNGNDPSLDRHDVEEQEPR